MVPDTITRDVIEEASGRIQKYSHRTPVFTSRSINEITGSEIFFKCENFQRVGAFKFRGAVNAVFSLSDDEAKEGVATHSSGNHAQALSLAARLRGIRAIIVMPETAPRVKVSAVRGYGGEIIFCKPTLTAREETLNKVIGETKATFIHPYNDRRVIAGQATCALELLEDVQNLDSIMAPVGGGGLISGTALATHYLSPETLVIAAEPKAADDAYRSFKSGTIIPINNPQTIADGLRTSLSEVTFSIIREHVTDIVTVAEDSIIAAMRLIWERMKILVEPSAAVPLAALLEKSVYRGMRIGIILSGGNVDLDTLPFS